MPRAILWVLVACALALGCNAEVPKRSPVGKWTMDMSALAPALQRGGSSVPLELFEGGTCKYLTIAGTWTQSGRSIAIQLPEQKFFRMLDLPPASDGVVTWYLEYADDNTLIDYPKNSKKMKYLRVP